MGTRGLFGFCYKGKYYIIYNHYDSYPQGLGNNLLKEIKKAIDAGLLNDWKEKIQGLVIIVPGDIPTPEQIIAMEPYTNLSLGWDQPTWYCYLHKCQGSFERVLSSGYIDNSDGIQNVNTRPILDLFLEYLYILNFDDQTFGCWSNDGQEAIFPLSDLPADLTNLFEED